MKKLVKVAGRLAIGAGVFTFGVMNGAFMRIILEHTGKYNHEESNQMVIDAKLEGIKKVCDSEEYTDVCYDTLEAVVETWKCIIWNMKHPMRMLKARAKTIKAIANK